MTGARVKAYSGYEDGTRKGMVHSAWTGGPVTVVTVLVEPISSLEEKVCDCG